MSLTICFVLFIFIYLFFPILSCFIELKLIYYQRVIGQYHSRCKLRNVLLWRIPKKSDVEMMKQHDGTVSIVTDGVLLLQSLKYKRRTV